jgi:hypothetical protein
MKPGAAVSALRWRAETIAVWTFYRAELARHGEPLALVVGPTTDGRWQARCGSPSRSTRELAEAGDYLTTEPTAARAKSCAAGWALGV